VPANKAYVVGLTGGTGCGKSEAARYLASLGAKHIDADAISHALTADGGAAIEAIRQTFGDAVFFENGSLNRRALHDLVFSSMAHKRALEGIIHPMVQRYVMDEIEAAADEGYRVDHERGGLHPDGTHLPEGWAERAAGGCTHRWTDVHGGAQCPGEPGD